MAAQLLIADVPWLLYRSFFALPKSIRGAHGQPVNALLGTVNAILSVHEGPLTAPGALVVACMGAEQADYRVALYPPYHAHREPMPEQLAVQWELAPALLQALGWTFASSAQLEADDVMFSYAREAQGGAGEARGTAAGDGVAPAALLLTGDRDLYGAVGERVALVELLKGGEQGLVGPGQVRERYGVEPAQVPDFIALRGDPSDGLPGAPGIGAKTAAQLLRAHGTLEGVLEAAALAATDARAAGMSARVAAALRDNRELLGRFKEIATLQRIAVQAPAGRPTDYAGGAQAARELGMARLAERLDRLAAGDG